MESQTSNFHRNFFEWTELLELNWEIDACLLQSRSTNL